MNFCQCSPQYSSFAPLSPGIWCTNRSNRYAHRGDRATSRGAHSYPMNWASRAAGLGDEDERRPKKREAGLGEGAEAGRELGPLAKGRKGEP